MADYDKFIALAQRLITKYGIDAVWESRSTAAEPGKSWEPAAGDPPVQHPIVIALLPMNSAMLSTFISRLPSLGYQAGTNLPRGNTQGLVAGGIDFTMGLQDTLLLPGGRRVKPITIEILSPALVDVLYTIQMEL